MPTAILVRSLYGHILKTERKKKALSIREVAIKAGISPSYLTEVERGLKDPSSEILAAICTALDFRISIMLNVASAFSKELHN